MATTTVPRSGGSGIDLGTRYDWLLAAIPIPVVIGWVAGASGVLSVPFGVALGSVVAAAVVGYALFVDAPVPTDRSAYTITGSRDDDGNGSGTGPVAGGD